MILRYDLPNLIEKRIDLSENEKVYYAVPFDIDGKGKWTNISYLVVTTKKVIVFNGTKKEEYAISDLEQAKAELQES